MADDVNAEVVNDEKPKNPDQQEGSQGEQKQSANSSMNLALFGGLVGAGIGLLLNPEKTKNVFRNVGESELAKTAAREFRLTAQNLLAAQAQQSISKLASTNEGIQTEDSTQSYEELKSENQNLNERLGKIEQMLNELVESKEA